MLQYNYNVTKKINSERTNFKTKFHVKIDKRLLLL